MLSVCLLLIALIVNVVFREGYRVLICFVAVFATVFHLVFFNDAESFQYYGTASIASLATILAISIFSNSPLGTDIQVISLLGIFVNMLGFYHYWAGLPPELYNGLMTALIIAEFIRLMMRTDRDRVHGALESTWNGSGVCFDDNSRNSANSGGHK